MKKTNRSSHDELNLTNYSAMKNILYCLNNTVKCHSPLLCLCSLKILIGTLIPILTTILPKIVIEMITAKQSVYKLASAILSFMGSLAILSGADKVDLSSEIQNEHILSQTCGTERIDN